MRMELKSGPRGPVVAPLVAPGNSVCRTNKTHSVPTGATLYITPIRVKREVEAPPSIKYLSTLLVRGAKIFAEFLFCKLVILVAPVAPFRVFIDQNEVKAGPLAGPLRGHCGTGEPL